MVAGIATTGQANTPEPQVVSENAAATAITANAAANLDFARVASKSIPAEKKAGSTTDAASSEIQAVNDPKAAQAFAASQLGSFGWDQSQMSCLVSLWTRESGWRTTAENPSSLAYGIAQSLPAERWQLLAPITGPITKPRSPGAWATSSSVTAAPAEPGANRRRSAGTEQPMLKSTAVGATRRQPLLI
jgi:hypothetical protein